MQKIELYKQIIIQITTPTSTGTGFYVKEYDLIISNFHVVENNLEVTISGKNFEKVLSKIVFIDPMHDLAFIAPPEGVDFEEVFLSQTTLQDRDSIVAIGHPYGLKYTSTQGIVSKASRLYNGLKYIQIDVAINPGNSGGPLANAAGEIVGINSFKIREGANLGFALPVSYLKSGYNDFVNYAKKGALRCPSCTNIVSIQELDEDNYCTHCGSDLAKFIPKEYEVLGVAKVIEQVIQGLGKNVILARRGANNWEIKEGSAKILLSYNQASGAIFGDSYLCKLPKKDIGKMYDFLLHQNYKLKYLRFSISKQDVILSLAIFSQFVKFETALEQIEYLLKQSDDYDDILVEEYGATWRSVENDK